MFKSKNMQNEKSARKRDAERIVAERVLNHKSRDNKKPSKKEKAAKNKSAANVHNTIPYKKAIGGDIFLIADKTYSKAYTFCDENYNLGDENQQLNILTNYSNFLNTLDDTVDCQIVMLNAKINIEEFEKHITIKENNDKFDELRREYNSRVIKENITKGQNAIHKRLYITLTLKTADEEYARRRFKTLDLELRNSFSRIGHTELRPLTSQERIEVLKDIFLGTDVSIPSISKSDFAAGLDKLFISPDYFEFKADYFMWDDTYAKVIFIKDYPSRAMDDVMTDLLGTSLEIVVTTNVLAHDPAKARKLVQKQITAIDTNMAQRESKAAQHGNFSNQTPVRIQNMLDGYKGLYEKITVGDQKLFSVNTIILVKAKTFDELNNNVEIIASSLKRNGFALGYMKWQQEDGLADCLPLGSQRRFPWRRSLPTESVAIMQPFNAKEIQQRDCVYYGMNVLSNNIISFDRIKSLINPSGFILGCPGGGKSFAAKREMIDVFLRYHNADILIIDPEREYIDVVKKLDGENVKIALGSKNFINPFEFDLALLEDEEIDVIGDKCQLLTSFISCMDVKNPINAQEKSFIDRCVRKTYVESGYLETYNRKDLPTLGDFYEIMKKESDINESIKEKLTTTLELYVTGSAKYFNNQTNVNVDNRVISYDIKELSGTLKTQSMLLILDYIWNRLSANRDKGKSTWIYIDEIYLLFADEYCLEFLRALYKRARKYGGVLTGITQNVEDLLRNDDCRTMLSNSEFLMFLKQSPADIAKLQDTLHFTDSETHYVSNVKAGQGLLILGSGGKDKIPFYDSFPVDTELYNIMSTNFSEKSELLQAAKNKKKQSND